MKDPDVIRALGELGMDDLSYKAVAMLPLIQVAWADGAVQDPEKALVLDLAETRFEVGEEGAILVKDWLRYPPSADYFRKGRDALVALVTKEPEHGLGEGLLDELVELSKRVAKSSGGLFGIGAVSRSESQALDQISKQLGDASVPEAAEPLAKDFSEKRGRVTITFASTMTLDMAGTSGGVLEPDPSYGMSGRIKVDRNGVTIGSDEQADLRVEADPSVSPMHCRFFERNRKFYVADLDSEAGTFVGRERVAERRLIGGEIVRVGQIELTFKLLRKIPKQMAG